MVTIDLSHAVIVRVSDDHSAISHSDAKGIIELRLVARAVLEASFTISRDGDHSAGCNFRGGFVS